MQTNSRRSLANVTIFEDGRTPLPVQRSFPNRRHLTNTKTAQSTTPTARWRQQTLTQITPSFSHLSSGFGSFDGNDELEFDNLEAAMPPKKRHRRTSNLPVQKQTITQMDPFKLQRYSDQDPLPSDMERSTSPPQRKKRKSLSTTPVARTNRLEALPAEKRQQALDPKKLRASPVPKSPDITILPPQTPITIRRKDHKARYTFKRAVGKYTIKEPGNFAEESACTVGRKETIADSDDDAADPASQSSDKDSNDEISRLPTVSSLVEETTNASATEPLKAQKQEQIRDTLLPYKDSDSYLLETVPTQLLSQPTRHTNPRPAPTTALREGHDPDNSLDSEEGTIGSPHETVSSKSPTRLLGCPVLETESQFDNAWRDYSSPLENGDASKTNGEDIVAGIHAHEPSLSLVNHSAGTYSSTDLHSLPLIPPSQATTADITQASLQDDQLLQQTSARNIGLQVASSPPQQRPALSSSSPFQTRKGPVADTYMGYQGWNGVSMTESQLLPNSLLDDSQGLRLMADVEEGLELETEEY
ncbi:MAG: hypothetical protein Q9180_005306 [Flavoplaca navasiana]